MNQRPSLMDQAGISNRAPEAKASANAKGGSRVNPDQLKLIGALAAIAVAGVLIAWSQGFIGGKPKANPQQQAQRQERFEEQLQEEKKEDATSRTRRIEAGG